MNSPFRLPLRADPLLWIAALLLVLAAVGVLLSAPGWLLAWTVAAAAFSLLLALRALRRERQAAALALAAAEADRTRMLAAASHDMRQPLHAITLYLNALERRVETDETRGIVAKMDRAAQTLSAMFADLLELSRLQSGATQAMVSDFALNDVIGAIVADYASGAVEASGADIALRSDPALIERILRRLVDNAMQHGGGKARIDVSVDDANASIAVIDAGPGVAPDDQARIFDDFVRIKRGAESEGMGVGLAIARRSAALLGGSIEMTSTPGEGARFVLRAPLAR